MAQFILSRNRLTSPPFIAEQFSEQLLIPGGARLDLTAAATGNFMSQVNGAPAGILKDANGKIRIPAGVVVVRALTDGPSTAASFTRADPQVAAFSANPQQPVETYTNANTTSNANPAPIQTAPISPPLATWPTTFAKGFRLAADADFNTDGTPVATIGEYYLTAFEVVDAAAKPDIELIRWQALIYINWLPFWPTPLGGLQNNPSLTDLGGNVLTGTALTNATALFWPPKVQAAIRRVYQITYGREVA